MNALKGWTTYLVAGAAVLASVIAVANGAMTWVQFFQTAEVAGLFATLRHAASVRLATHVTSFLSGYKTYLVAAGGILGPLVAMAQDRMGLIAGLQMIVTAVLGARMRAGIAR